LFLFIFQSTIVNQQSSINNHQSTIINHEGGGVDISSFSGKKAGDQKETFAKYRQDQE